MICFHREIRNGGQYEDFRIIVFKTVHDSVYLLCMVSRTQSADITERKDPVFSDYGLLDGRFYALCIPEEQPLCENLRMGFPVYGSSVSWH